MNKASSSIDFGGIYLPTGLAAPSAAGDAARKGYADALAKMGALGVSAVDTQSTTSLTYVNLPDMTRTTPAHPTGGTWTVVLLFRGAFQIAVGAGAPTIRMNVAGSGIAASETAAGIITTGKNEDLTCFFVSTEVPGSTICKLEWKSSGGAAAISVNSRTFAMICIQTNNLA